MDFTKDEVLQYVEEEDVKFIRLVFFTKEGVQKNISIMPGKLPEAFKVGIPIDPRAVLSDPDPKMGSVFLHPDQRTLALYPWRPEHGRVVRMFCTLTDNVGRPLPEDLRSQFNELPSGADKVDFKIEMDFYLFLRDENQNPTKVPYDKAGYLDIAPGDKCENVRREIMLAMEVMGVCPESSCHSFGPGQNRISFVSTGALKAADDLATAATVIRTLAAVSGLYADLSNKQKGSEKSILSITKIHKDEHITGKFSPDINPYMAILRILKRKK